MSEENIFNSEATTSESVPSNESVTEEQPKEQQEAAPDYGSILSQITNEDGNPKYSDVNAALNSIPAAQQHIGTLEQENAKLREELEKRAAAEDLLKQLQSKQEQTGSKSEPVSTDQIAQIVEQVVGTKEAQKTAQANQAQVVAALTEKFGDQASAEKAYVEMSQQVGLDVNAFNTLAAKSPKAVLAFFGSTAPKPTPAPMKGSVSTEAFQSNNRGEADMSVIKRASGPCSTNDGIAAWREAGKLVNR